MSRPPDDESNGFQFDRTAFSVVDLAEPDDSTAYWLTRPVEERLRALELLRKAFYGDPVDGRLQRVLEVAEFKPR